MVIQQHIVDTIGTVDDLIERNKEFLRRFQIFLKFEYNKLSLKENGKCKLSDLIIRTGKILKNKEWFDSKVIDLSTMPNDNIFIDKFSDGLSFSTNIKTINKNDLVYGSIRPYFKKAGFNWKTNYVVGSVYSFNTKREDDYLWVLSCICSEEFHKYTFANSQGTKMPIINWDSFVNFELPYSEKSAATLQSTMKPLFELALIKLKENDCLETIKSCLLKEYF